MAENSLNRDRALEALESADPALSDALKRLGDEEEQELQQTLREGGTVAAPPDFLDKVLARMPEDSSNRDQALEALESADPALSDALKRLGDEEEQELQQTLREGGTVATPPDFLDKVLARIPPPPPPPLWILLLREIWEWVSNRSWLPETRNIVFGLGGAAATAVIIILVVPDPRHSLADHTLALVSSFQENPEHLKEIFLNAAKETLAQSNIEDKVQAAATGSLTARAATTAFLTGSPREAKELFLQAEKQSKAKAKKIEHIALAAQASLSAGDYKDAHRLFLKAAKETATVPDRVPYLIGAARAAFSAKDYKEAHRLFLKATEAPLAQAANAAWYDCDYEATITILEEHFKGEKETTEIHFMLGSAYHGQGNLDEAMKYYRQVVDSAQKDQSRFVESAWFNLGAVHAARFKKGQEQDLSQALDALKKSIRAAPDKERRRSLIQTAVESARDGTANVDKKKTCGEKFHATEDLTPLDGRPELDRLLTAVPLATT